MTRATTILLTALALTLGCDQPSDTGDTGVAIDGVSVEDAQRFAVDTRDRYRVLQHQPGEPRPVEDGWLELGDMLLQVENRAPQQVLYKLGTDLIRGSDAVAIEVYDRASGVTALAALDKKAGTLSISEEGAPRLELSLNNDGESLAMDGVEYTDLVDAADAVVLSAEARDIHAELYAAVLVLSETSERLGDDDRLQLDAVVSALFLRRLFWEGGANAVPPGLPS
jgi:hypothetical protein